MTPARALVCAAAYLLGRLLGRLAGQRRARRLLLRTPLPPRALSDPAGLRQMLDSTCLPHLYRLWCATYGEPMPDDTTEVQVEVVPMTEDGPGRLRRARLGEHHAEVHLHLTVLGPLTGE